MNKISDLAAFDTKKLATLLHNLPERTVVFGLEATGPLVAMPPPNRFEDHIVGQFYYRDDSIEVWDGSHYQRIAALIELDGKPTLILKGA